MLLGEEAFQISGSPLDGVFLRTDSTDDGFFLYGLNLLSTRHQEGSNITFIDGHSKWLRPEQVYANKYPTGRRRYLPVTGIAALSVSLPVFPHPEALRAVMTWSLPPASGRKRLHKPKRKSPPV